MDASLVGQAAAGSPIAIGVVLVGIALAVAKRVLASVGRLGARVGDLEQGRVADLHADLLEQTRRWQLEAVLMAAGVDLPPWPDLTDVVQPPTPRHALPDWSPTR